MKALSYLGPGNMVVIEKEIPTPKDNEVLIKVKACGICGSDVHGYLGITGRRIPPVTMGHEFAGEITQLGKDAHMFKVGDNVVVQPINFCGECANCTQGMTNMCLNKKFFGVLSENGAMAQYVAVPEKLLYPLPDGCSHSYGALAEPLAVAYGSFSKYGSVKGKTVVIIGAGTIGLCVLALAKLQNPSMIIVSDFSEKRLEIAKEMGADHVINPSRQDFLESVSQLTNGKMADVSVEAVGVEPAANQSIRCVKVGGTAIWLGMSAKEITINMQDVVTTARTIIGSFNYTHVDFGKVVELLSNKDLDLTRLITKEITIEQAPDIFKQLAQTPDEFLKVEIVF